MSEKYHYVIISTNTIDGANYGWYTDPGKIYFSYAESFLDDHSTSCVWTEHLAEAATFDSAERAWDAIHTIWGRISWSIHVLIVTDEHMNEKILGHETYVAAREKKVAANIERSMNRWKERTQV